MFRWIPLVWANMRRRKLRLILTFASILIAFMLFGILEAMRTSMVEGVNLAGADRLAAIACLGVRHEAGHPSPDSKHRIAMRCSGDYVSRCVDSLLMPSSPMVTSG